MTREERELTITYLEEMKESYIEGYGYERHPLPEYYAIENAIKALEQEPFINKPCVSEKVCEHDKQMVLDKIRAEIEQAEFSLDKSSDFQDDRTDTEKFADWSRMIKVILCEIIDKYKAESEE